MVVKLIEKVCGDAGATKIELFRRRSTKDGHYLHLLA